MKICLEKLLWLPAERSGKSEFAERYVLHYSPKCDYVATAEILDEEVAERVRLHRERRDARWINHEAPYHAERTLEALSAETGAVLFDCLTVYMCNLLYGRMRRRVNSWSAVR